MSELSRISKVGVEAVLPRAGSKASTNKIIPASPIGIYDSGVGGLTVLAQIQQKLHNEDVIYLADTARVPYGSKTPAEIIKINQEIIPFLINRGAKLIVMACGTSSAIAYPVLKDEYPVELINLIDPGAAAALNISRNGKIGVIATVATVNSHAYQQKIKELNSDAEVFAAACPLFVPLIEGGFTETDETKKVAKEYLKPLLKEEIDTLILGCTHYPHLTKIIKEICGPKVALVDPAEEAAEIAKQMLKKAGTLKSGGKPAKYTYFTTAHPGQFQSIGSRLLGKTIALVKEVKICSN